MFLASKNGKQVLVNLCFLEYKGEFGGKNRSLQIQEMFEDHGFELRDVSYPSRPSKLALLFWSLRYVAKFRLYRPLGANSFREGGIRLYTYTKIFNQFPEVTHFVQEGTGFGALVCAPIIKSFGKKLIFTPANIEGMAPYDEAWTHQIPLADRLREEFYYFKYADAVFCISKEEAWLLRIAGVNAHFLPYIPPRGLMAKIETRRANRKPDKRFGLLYFANFHNAPNILAFKKLMNDLKSKTVVLPYPLKVAGLGAESMKEYAANIDGVEFMGELSNQELENCFQRCVGVVLFHHPTSGMLTRVPEMIFSGIPIMGNEDALKAYGVYLGFNSFTTESSYDDIVTMLTSNCKTQIESFMQFIIK